MSCCACLKEFAAGWGEHFNVDVDQDQAPRAHRMACGRAVCSSCSGGGRADAGEGAVASPRDPTLRLDRLLCGLSCWLCLGKFELEPATRSFQLARSVSVI